MFQKIKGTPTEGHGNSETLASSKKNQISKKSQAQNNTTKEGFSDIVKKSLEAAVPVKKLGQTEEKSAAKIAPAIKS